MPITTLNQVVGSDSSLVFGGPGLLLSENLVPVVVLAPQHEFLIALNSAGDNPLLEIVELPCLMYEIALGELSLDH